MPSYISFEIALWNIFFTGVSTKGVDMIHKKKKTELNNDSPDSKIRIDSQITIFWNWIKFANWIDFAIIFVEEKKLKDSPAICKSK